MDGRTDPRGQEVITIPHPEHSSGELKLLKNLLLQNQESFETESYQRLKAYQVCSNDDHLFMARSNFHPYAFVWGK